MTVERSSDSRAIHLPRHSSGELSARSIGRHPDEVGGRNLPQPRHGSHPDRNGLRWRRRHDGHPSPGRPHHRPGSKPLAPSTACRALAPKWAPSPASFRSPKSPPRSCRLPVPAGAPDHIFLSSCDSEPRPVNCLTLRSNSFRGKWFRQTFLVIPFSRTPICSAYPVTNKTLSPGFSRRSLPRQSSTGLSRQNHIREQQDPLRHDSAHNSAPLRRAFFAVSTRYPADRRTSHVTSRTNASSSTNRIVSALASVPR